MILRNNRLNMIRCTGWWTYSKAIRVTALWKFPGEKDAGLCGQID